jgi:type VI secretion system protein VasJ
MDDALMAIQKAAYFIEEQEKSNPLGWRLNRMLKWGGISGSLPEQGGRTSIPAPYPHVLEGIRGLAAGQAWADLLGAAENAFSDSGVLWLDLQRFLCQALQAQGGEYAACAKAIRMELALLLQRSPGLSDLSFDDGTPFADAMTKEWIETEVMSSLGGGGGGMAQAAIKKKGDVGEEQKAAEALLGEGKLDQALHALRTGLSNDSSEKNNFDRKQIMAELCFKGNKPNIAKAILEDLLSVIERQGLERWDPDLCVSVYHLAQKVYLALAEALDEVARVPLREKAVAMHTQISKLNPVLAISVDFK